MTLALGQRVARLAGLGLGLGLAASAWAAQRFPPPQFETGHTLPATTTPPPDAFWRDALDVTVLAAALGLAAWLVLRRRSRKAVLGLVIFSLVYFGFWRQGCVCPIGAIQNVTLALSDPGHTLPLVVGAFFLLPLLATILFGRVFCAGVCPLGAIQDLVVLKPVTVPRWLDDALGMGAYLYLGGAVLLAATGSAWIICQFDPFVGLFRMSGTAVMLGLGALFLLAGVFLARPYCRWLCPYGVLLSWIAPGALWQAEIDPVGCTRCELCRDGCPVNAIEAPDTATVAATDRRQDRRRMATLLLIAPLLVGLGLGMGAWLAPTMARADERVRLSDRLVAEDMQWVQGHTDATQAFRSRGESRVALEAEVQAVKAGFAWGAPIFGGFIGLVLAGKLIQHARRPRRELYSIDQARCVACARCFALCPHHRQGEAMPVQLTHEEAPL